MMMMMMMEMSVLLLLMGLSCVSAPPPWVGTPPATDTLFQGFKQRYGRTYHDNYEEAMRKQIFASNLERIKDHNELYERGETSYYQDFNQFADMTNQEFQKMNGLRLSGNNSQNDNHAPFKRHVREVLPQYVNWTAEGYVTHVKDQTGSLEGQHFRKTGNLVSLSEQNLVDCSSSYGNHGCNGGNMVNSFKYVIHNPGIAGELVYPYSATEGSCSYSVDKKRTECHSYTMITQYSETQLQQAVADVGPVSVAIDASQSSFQLYGGGVYDEPGCSSTQLNHGVLVVGYGTSQNDYWLVKNSWDTTWGESGYIRMSRNKNNQCGIASSATYPIIH